MNFDSKSDIRIRETELSKIKLVVAAKKEKYSSTSHFVRCAIIKLLQDEV